MPQDFGASDDDLFERPTIYRDDLFKGQVVVVSGGGSGLGKAMAALFGRLGARIVICGRDQAKLDAVKTLFDARGISCSIHSMSIREPEAVDAFFDQVFADEGKIDILINNAGGQFPQDALNLSPNGWRAVIDTNLNGSWNMMQAAAKRWRDRSAPGNMINIVADIWRGLPQMAHTTAARAGVIYASRTVAVEWAQYDIRVNCLAPGCCESSAFGRYPAEGAESFKQSNPMLRAGDEWDIAEGAVYLASPAGKFITGETLTIDGGQQLWGDPWPGGRPAWAELDYSKGRGQR
jgi:citronellol/citronellal dehydrogenase